MNWVKILSRKGNNSSRSLHEEFQLPQDFIFCHKDKVHIFVRGLADGKLHAAKNRNYSDFRFYKKDGLKVFCAVCRKRLV
ncbi:MAG: hypothetical protein HY094_08150 [Candidatus Melainabacteria bacterium]|nr:hypothetical protein [Candidatus Melainabacteria bacterium]